VGGRRPKRNEKIKETKKPEYRQENKIKTYDKNNISGLLGK
jgi:hypothetical protein